MTRFLMVLLGLFLTMSFARAADAPGGAAPAKVAAVPADDKPHIDIVVCFDCSGSMGPVIETAKQKVWAIVNQTAKAKPSPILRIGLIGYGNAMGPFRTLPLTDDLDEVYKFLVTFNDRLGGDEYVGLAVHRATDDMKWSEGKQVLKVIYVVGNETARQGPPEFDYAKTAPAAIAKGIIVNAIYCGDFDRDVGPPSWREMAKLADGRYMEIAATGGAVVVATPFDDDLTKFSSELNGTYICFGEKGQAGAGNQLAQDGNASGFGKSVAADRALAKASPGQYRNAGWDLVDASKEKDFSYKTLKDDQLPEEMRKMTLEERKAYVEKKTKEREVIQLKIKELAVKRDAFIKDEVEKKGLTSDKAFDNAVRDSLKAQAESKGYKFDEK